MNKQIYSSKRTPTSNNAIQLNNSGLVNHNQNSKKQNSSKKNPDKHKMGALTQENTGAEIQKIAQNEIKQKIN